jgi:hypothetical protein
MIDPQGIVFTRLIEDATLVALLQEFDLEPAVFEDGKVDPEYAFAVLPIAVVTPPTNNGNPDTLDASLRDEQVSVRLYHKPDGSSLPLHQASERVRALFKNWGSAAVDGGTVIHAEVSGPFPAPTDDPSLDGRIVSISLLIKET